MPLLCAIDVLPYTMPDTLMITQADIASVFIRENLCARSNPGVDKAL